MPWTLPNGWTLPSWNTAQQSGPVSGPAPAFGGTQPNLAINQSVMSPLFGRPGWTYVEVRQTPSQGPTPRLAQGTGLTGSPSNRQVHGFVPGGFLTQTDYRPDGFDFQPPTDPTWLRRIPRSIGVGYNGRELVGTYEPHDFTPAEFGTRQWRSASNWQEMTYPPGWRNTLGWQQAARYNLYQTMNAASVLPQANYFLGYQIQPNVGQSLPSSGGMGRVLGS